MKTFLIFLVAISGQGPLFAQKANLTSLNKSPEVTIRIQAVKQNSADISKAIASAKTSAVVSRDKTNKVISNLGNITISGDQMFYKLILKNRSNIGFDIDFIRFYVRDLKTAKRTVSQETEIYPLDSYGQDRKSIEGKSAGVYVFTINKFPISKDRALFVEIYEKNGARHLTLKVRQSDIENARSFK